MKMTITLFLLVLALGSMAFGAAETHLGPHGGYLRSSGTLRTEVLALGAARLKVYFDGTPVAASPAVALVDRKGAETFFTCHNESDHFICELPAGRKLRTGDKIKVKAGSASTTYKVPLTHG